MDRTANLQRLLDAVNACDGFRNGEAETPSVLDFLAQDPATLGVSPELIAYAHLASATWDGRHFLPAIHRFREEGREDQLPDVLKAAKAYGDIRSVWELRKIGRETGNQALAIPDFADWFQAWGLPRIDVYRDEETARLLPEDAALVRGIVQNMFGDQPDFWEAILKPLRQDPAYPSYRVALLERLACGEDPVVKVVAPSYAAGADFQRFAEEHGLTVLRPLQTGWPGPGGNGSVFLVIDSDGLAKVFKEMRRPELDRFGVGDTDEASIYASLGSAEGLPRFYGKDAVGKATFLRLGVCYGQPLEDYVTPTNLLTRDEAFRVIAKLASTLSGLHAKGIAYLDVRPQNVKVDGVHVHLLDLGDARTVPPRGLVQTRIHDPKYAAPETVRRAEAGCASDIFQLGILFVELLTGRHPFAGRFDPGAGETAIGSFLRHALANVLAEAEVPPIPILQRMLDRDPAKRPTTAEVAKSLSAEASTQGIIHRNRKRLPTNGTVLFPARMGIPHRGHIDFMARILELGYKLVVSVQQSYLQDENDPLPKWLVVKMVAQALLAKGFDLADVRFLCTPLFDTTEQHRLHFAMMPGAEELVAVASGNPAVHQLFAGRLPAIDQPVVFAEEGEDYETRSWGAKLRHAIRAGDRTAFGRLIAPEAERILSFEEMREACAAPPLFYVWGNPDWGRVWVEVLDTEGNFLAKRRVGAYTLPEDAALTAFSGAAWIDRFARDSTFHLDGSTRRLVFVGVRLDAARHEIITFRVLDDAPAQE